MTLIDSHFHLTQLGADWTPNEAICGGLAVTTHPNEWQAALISIGRLSSAWRCALGVHPWFADVVVDWTYFDRLLAQHPYLAVGEIGLDGSKGLPSEEQQLKVFKHQLDCARLQGRLLSLHLVNDHERGYHLIRACKGLKGGIIHAFSGSLVQAKQWQSLGFHLGIGPRLLTQLTDKRRQMLQSIDLSMIHLESDAPFVHHRCQVSSPNDLRVYLPMLASVLNLTPECLSGQLSENWQQLWGA